MFPHERSLVKKLENKPFALLGINTDGDRKQVNENNEMQQITWRSWFDGSPKGPICKQYNVSLFPTILVLDDKGVIRYTDTQGQALDDAVDALLKEMAKQ
jgi:hypothetical protein